MRGLVLPAVGLLALVAGARPARAGVVVGEGVPFTAEELADAIEARTGDTVGDIAVEMSPGADLRLITPDGTWEVVVGEARGSAAARMVALHVVDQQALGALALPPAAPSPTSSFDDLEEPSLDIDTETPPPATRGPWAVLGAGIARGTASTDLAALVATIEIGGERERWLGAGEIGVHVSRNSTDAGEVHWAMPHGRLSLGRRLGPVEILGGLLVGQMYFSNLPNRSSATMVAIGGHARVVQPIGRGRWQLVAGFGADVYQNRLVIRRAGMEEASTPRLSFNGTIGFSKVLGP